MPAQSPQVSIVIRSMDRAVLQRALDSVAMQDFTGSVEIVVVAACGRAHRAVPAQVGRHPCVLVAKDQPMQRAQAANVGLEATRGRCIAFLDDDDELLPDMLSTLAEALAIHPEADLAHAQSLVVDAQGVTHHVLGGPWIEWRQLTHGFIQPGGAMFRRTLIDQGIRFDETLEILEDMEFFVQCAQKARFVYCAKPVFRYYAAEGTSGAVVNRDDARIDRALACIRGKWAALAERLDAMPPARIARAQRLLRSGCFEEALDVLASLRSDAAAGADVYVNALNLSAVASMRLGRLDAARKMLDTALALAPGHAGLLANLALVERKAGGTP